MMTSESVKNNKESRRCAYCGTEAPIVWVHGHGQCSRCGINVEECCRGEQCEVSSLAEKRADG
ncbi:MAG: hypothetical protein JXR26_05720 [Balneolaceae bacterium]|nr:hypothetical protein [Balneolaceae bacterium]